MNRCRSEDAVAPLLDDYDRNGVRILLPAISHWELSKGGTAGTVEASMRILARRPEALGIARHTYVFKRNEKKYRRPLGLDTLLDRPHTENFHDVLRGLRDDTHTVDPATIEAKRDHWRTVLDHEEEPRVLRQLADLHRHELAQPRANEIRRALQGDPADRGLFRDYLREAVGDRDHLAAFLVAVGYGHVTAKRLTTFASFSILHLIALHAVALRWRIFGGAEGASDAVLENEMIDVEYAVLASYGRGLVTADAGARATYDDLLAVASELWPRASAS
jgi:hypothetical protein